MKLDLARDSWRSVLGTRGVSHMIMEGDRPKPARLGLVEELLVAASDAGLISRPPELRVGESVRLQTGPFSGLVGELLSMSDDGRVRVLMNLLGSPTIVRSTHLGLVPAA